MIREQFNWLAEKSSRMLIIDEIDAVARSRRISEIHSDEMASVNELLVQIDRVLRLGRLIVGCTNFVGSLDEALTRSGRFGRYIPIGPPNLEESVLIVRYYLDKLRDRWSQSDRIRLTAPDETCVRDVLRPFFDQNHAAGSRFCGADLEEAVNQAYVDCARAAEASIDDQASEQSALFIQLTGQDLVRSLNEVPMSVTADMMNDFSKDIARYCGARLARSYDATLG
jgi:SpoVK/Ycf46/Vps4 family AAA+-type ATPase